MSRNHNKELSLTIDQREKMNVKKLAAKAIRPDFDFSKEEGKLLEALKNRLSLERRAKDSLYLSLCRALKLVLAVETNKSVRAEFHEHCKARGKSFKAGTPIAYRVAIAFLSSDKQRASDYGKALRGAIIKGFTPAKLEKRLRNKSTSIAALMTAVDVSPSKNRAKVIAANESMLPRRANKVGDAAALKAFPVIAPPMKPGGSNLKRSGSGDMDIKLLLSPWAKSRMKKVRSSAFALGVIRINPKKNTLFVSSFFADVDNAVERFKKKIAEN